MNRMIKLFQQKSNKKFDEYLLAKKKSLSPVVTEVVLEGREVSYPTIQDVHCSVLKAESDVWARAAELLRQEELNQK
jgi:hypothetical protein